eukprot:COSAG03_NODE_7446_length_917_cov_4.426181_1_plen_60_part_01
MVFVVTAVDALYIKIPHVDRDLGSGQQARHTPPSPASRCLAGSALLSASPSVSVCLSLPP